jgi:hypothetical protein
MRIGWAEGSSMFASVATSALLVVGLTACGVNTAGSAAAPVKTVTATAPASHANGSPAGAAQDNGNSAGASQDNGSPVESSASPTGKLPDYRPSTVVSESRTTTVFKSPDSVEKIGTFYRGALASGGWDTISASVGSFHASFTARRSHEGLSISVYPGFGGSGISISQYPI